MKPKAIDHVVESEVLVIGSGLAGSLAAVGCHQLGKKVVIVNKGRLCWGGATIVCGGRSTSVCFPTDDKDSWMKDIVVRGDYLADQEWVRIFLEESYGSAMALNELGKECNKVVFPPDPQDKESGLWHFRGYGQKVPMNIFLDLTAAADALRKKIIAEKIGFLEMVEITHLLTDGRRVTGAVGFNYRTGETYLFPAKAVVLAAGCCRFRSEVVDAGGEGIAMAYEAGARMKGFDVGGARMRPRYAMHTGIMGDSVPNGPPYLLGAKLVNRLGEAFFQKATPKMKASARLGLDMAMQREIAEGRGPVFEDYTQIPPEVKEVFKRTRKAGWKLAKAKYGVDAFEARVPFGERQEQTAIPATGPRAGGVEIDHGCGSSIPGLYAVGDATWPVLAAQHPEYTGFIWAILSGSRVGKFAVEYAASAPSRTITDKELMEQAGKHINTLAFPLTRTSGLSPDEVISRLLRCLIPYDEVHSDKESMSRALTEIARLQSEDLPNIKARDYHELKKAVEAQSMLLSAEMILRSELFREESRCGVRRKDFPMTDNVNWLKWIIVQKGQDKMQVYAEDVPTPYIEPPRIKYLPQLARV